MNITIKQILWDLRFFLTPYSILLLLCLVIKISFTKEEIFFAVNARHNHWADWLAPYFTDLGDGLTTIILTLVLALYSYRNAFLLGSSYAITSLPAQLLKHFINAPRPKLLLANHLKDIYFVKGVYIDSFGSFPSGHTVTAFSTTIVLLYLTKNKSLGLLLFPLAVCIGYSRMYLSEHFFEDVVAGSLLGLIITVSWLFWIDGRQFLHRKKFNNGLMVKRLHK